jgi:hypothetical protein
MIRQAHKLTDKIGTMWCRLMHDSVSPHSRSLPLLDVLAPVRSTMDRGATKDASHEDPDRCQSASKPAPARGVKP